jgi:hypothetical protein
MRYVVSVIVLEMILALGTSAAVAEDCHGQGHYFRGPTPPPPGQVQMPNPPQAVAPVGSEPSPPTLQDRRGENMGH